MSANVRVPVIDADSAPFWDAVAAHKLIAQKCAGCSRFIFYPRAICPFCHSAELSWEELRGTGTVYSVTVSRRAPSPEFADLVPYVVALIDLDEGCRMMSNIVGYDASLAQCGSRVQVEFQLVSDSQVLPMFVLTESQERK
jgi:uncharacterized OB-fold protein